MYVHKLKNAALPIKMWVRTKGWLWWKKPNIEQSCLQQLINLSNLPFIFRTPCIMPDGHTGYGMPIGGVVATKGVVIPNAVGVDIGCGMSAVKTSLKDINTETLKKIMGEIRKVVPVGNGRGGSHKEPESDEAMPHIGNVYYPKDEDTFYDFDSICDREYDNARHQLGTLGGGNHFIEIQKGSDGYIWIMIHSGSRNLGYKVANHYNDIAKELNKKWYSSVPKKWDLAFLPIDSEEGLKYLSEMEYCLNFAKANRDLMMENVITSFFKIIKSKVSQETWDEFCLENINIHHNYATMENHFGKNVMVHRKGATLARDNIGIIPGSQGSKSYIVKGKSNPESFHSCSHGAGRTMSRTKAKSELSLKDEIKKLDDQGIIHGMRNEKDLDEATGAYKDIDQVMENQKDLVDIVVELKPLAVIKG